MSHKILEPIRFLILNFYVTYKQIVVMNPVIHLGEQ